MFPACFKTPGVRSVTHWSTYLLAFLTSASRPSWSGSSCRSSSQNLGECSNRLMWHSSCRNTCRTRCRDRNSRLRFQLMFPSLEQLAQRVVCPLTLASLKGMPTSWLTCLTQGTK